MLDLHRGLKAASHEGRAVSDTRNIVEFCESRGFDRAYESASIVTPFGSVKCLRNEMDWGASLVRAAIDEWAAA